MKYTTDSVPEALTRAEARARGLRHYSTGKPCRYGHMAHRFTLDARCSECAKGFSARFRAKNLDEERAKDRRYRALNRERYNAYLAHYRIENRELVRSAEKRWRTNNLPRRRALCAKYYAAKKDRIPPWADLDAIRAFYENCPPGHEVDHIHPLQGEAISGLHVLNNLQYLTKWENQSKSNRFDPLEHNAVFDRLCPTPPE